MKNVYCKFYFIITFTWKKFFSLNKVEFVSEIIKEIFCFFYISLGMVSPLFPHKKQWLYPFIGGNQEILNNIYEYINFFLYFISRKNVILEKTWKIKMSDKWYNHLKFNYYRQRSETDIEISVSNTSSSKKYV